MVTKITITLDDTLSDDLKESLADDLSIFLIHCGYILLADAIQIDEIEEVPDEPPP